MAKLQRRQLIRLAAAIAVLPPVSRMASAQAYPTRPIHLIAPYPAGGPVDIRARLIGQSLAERLGQPFVVENRPGAGGNIGTEVAVRAPPDGYTLLLVNASNAFNATLYDKLTFNFARDIAPIAAISRLPFVMVVIPSVPANTVPEFIAYAKANPGKLNMASAGSGSPQHIAGELFAAMTGVNMVHVPYRGDALAIPALLAEQVQVCFTPMSTAIELIRAGKLRALAVTTATRLEALPDIPSIAEFVSGFEASGWTGIGAPRSTPVEIIDRLNREINASLSDPKIKVRLTELGDVVLALSPGDFGKIIADETEKWGKVIRAANIKPE